MKIAAERWLEALSQSLVSLQTGSLNLDTYSLILIILSWKLTLHRYLGTWACTRQAKHGEKGKGAAKRMNSKIPPRRVSSEPNNFVFCAFATSASTAFTFLSPLKQDCTQIFAVIIKYSVTILRTNWRNRTAKTESKTAKIPQGGFPKWNCSFETYFSVLNSKWH